jgi:anti-anti-sigma factor
VTRLSPDGRGGPTSSAAEVVLTGELDLATYEPARQRLAEAERRRPEVLVIDLSVLEFVDSTGVRLVLDADRRARAEDRRVAVRLGTGSAQRVFRTLGLLDVLDVVPDRDGGPPAGTAAP